VRAEASVKCVIVSSSAWKRVEKERNKKVRAVYNCEITGGYLFPEPGAAVTSVHMKLKTQDNAVYRAVGRGKQDGLGRRRTVAHEELGHSK
jgi:hypothetical protein